LSANLIRFCPVSDWLGACIHVALTARRELHSRSVSSLEESKSAYKKRDKQDQPERTAHSIKNKQEGDDDAGREGCDSKHQPLAPLSRADVGDAHGGVHLLFNLDDS
jgi:hypothetical protein